MIRVIIIPIYKKQHSIIRKVFHRELEYADYIKICKRKDPQFEKCALNSLENLRPRLKKGIPKIQVPSLEPLHIPTLSVARDLPAIQIKADMNNMKVYGASDFVLKKLKVDFDKKYTVEAELSLPKLYVVSDYDIKGSRILILPLDGEGDLKANISNVFVTVSGYGKARDKKGVKYLHAEHIELKVKVGKTHVRFRDEVRPLQAQTSELFFNNNSRAVTELLLPIAEETGAHVTKAFINRILDTIPLHELLPED